MRELVLPWGRSQEPNAPRVIGFDITLSHWLLFNLELPQSSSAAITECWDALVSTSAVWGHHIELVDTGPLTRFLSAWCSICFFILGIYP